MSAAVILTAVSVATSILAVIIAAQTFQTQKRQNNINLQATTLRGFCVDFFSPYMGNARFRASEFGLEKLDGSATPLPAMVFHLIDLLDSIAIFYNRGALDHEMAFAHFYYWASCYWSAFGSDIQRFEGEIGLKAYVNLPLMVEDMTALGKKYNWIESHYCISQERLRRFFNDEINECRSSPPSN